MTATRINCTNDEYHAMDGVSNSRLSVFLDDPQLYYQRFVAKTLAAPRPTPDQRFGTNVHTHLLEGVPVTVIPDDALSANAQRRGKAWTEFAIKHQNDILIKADEKPMWDAINRQVDRHDAARRLIRGKGESEVSLAWQDRLNFRVRIDRVSSGFHSHSRSFVREVLVDVKTCRSVRPQDFANEALRYSYHRQMVLYNRAWAAYTDWTATPFVFVCIRKSPPYTVEVIELDEEFWELGRQELDQAIEGLAECYETNTWEAPGHGEIKTLSPPRWASYQDEWEYAQ